MMEGWYQIHEWCQPPEWHKYLKDAFAEFQMVLHDEQREELNKATIIPDQHDIVLFAAQLDATHRVATSQKNGPGYASRIEPLLMSTVYFSNILRQHHPELSSIIWGTISSTMMWRRFNALVARSLLESRDQEFKQHLDNIRNCRETFDRVLVLAKADSGGSGKTIVTSSIIEHIQNDKSSLGCTLLYLFVPSNGNGSLKTRTFLESILRQCIQGLEIIPKVVIDNVRRLRSIGDFYTLFRQVTSTHQKLYILVDGLDEYDVEDQQNAVKLLATLVSTHENIHLFLTSRADLREEIQRNFEELEQLPLDCEATYRDIEIYVQGFLDRALDTGELRLDDPTLALEIKLTLTEGSQGSFLWVCEKLREICLQRSHESIQHILSNIRSGITESVTQVKGHQLAQLPMDTSSKYTSVFDRSLDETGDDSTRLTSEIPQDMAKVEVAESTYTSAIPNSQAYIQEFVGSLFKVSEQPDVDTLERIAELLPNLLRGFALSLGGERSGAENLEVMKFIHASRGKIVERFVQYYIRDRDDGVSLRRSSSDMSLATKIDQWSPELVTEDPNLMTAPPPPDTVAFGDPDQTEIENEDGNDDVQVAKYREIVAESAAFRWLQCRLNREIDMDSSKANVMHAISSKIRETLHSAPESRLISRHRGPRVFETTFASTWDPLAFVRGQEYVEEPGDALARAIVLVQGVDGNTQALSCSEYLSRTWHMCGEDLMSLIKQVVQSYVVILFDNTKLTAWLESSGYLSLKVVGVVDTIAEIGEMYGWMTVALSDAPTKAIIRATPILDIHPDRDGNIFRATFSCRPNGPLEASDGQCWWDLFRNPTIVCGFPVRCRQPAAPKGLEVTLPTLGGLLGAKRLTIIGDLLLLRGFCTMVVPTSYAGDTVRWHVLFNEDGSRIASTDDRIHDVAGDFRLAKHLTPSVLETRRHIIGWCRDVRNFAGNNPQSAVAPCLEISKKAQGTKGAQYKVRKSGLARPESRFAFDRITVSGGQFLTAGGSVAIGKKDRSARAVKATDYHKQLDWVEKRHVVLYNCHDRCGWLVDGLSALLHLTRAWIAHRREQDKPVEFEDDDIIEARPPLAYTGRRAAYSLLTNEDNMALRIYEKRRTRVEEISRKGKEKEEETILKTTRTWHEFPDLVGDICQTLGLLFDIQTDTKTLDGINFKIRRSPRRNLEGWDFHDVATNADPLWPKAASLHEWGWGWVDLVRGINAVVLFGNGFGDIIQPGRSPTSAGPTEGSTENTSCTHWATLPKRQDLLATTTAVLEDIMNETHQEDRPRPLFQLHSGIYWHSPDRVFDGCQCNTQASESTITNVSKAWGQRKQQHICDRIRVLLPTHFPSLHQADLRSPALPLPKHGAAIFGHSFQFRLKWPVEAGSTPRVMQSTEPVEMTITSPEGERVHESNMTSSTSNSEARTASTSSRVPEGSSSQTSTVASSVTAPSTAAPTDTAPSSRKRRDGFQSLLPGRWRKGRKG
ncbi:Pfs domain protein [Apiospora arundinis]|uniref:Pfs domain protein n=1 Tax=Apiospora arundinis TaxID=335852 RepID=A0ABR2JC80_9PEZI